MISIGNERRDWTLHEWQSIIWSDDSKINLLGMMGEFLCEEELEKTYCQNEYRKLGGSVMVWGCIPVMELVRLQRWKEE